MVSLPGRICHFSWQAAAVLLSSLSCHSLEALQTALEHLAQPQIPYFALCLAHQYLQGHAAPLSVVHSPDTPFMSTIHSCADTRAHTHALELGAASKCAMCVKSHLRCRVVHFLPGPCQQLPAC